MSITQSIGLIGGGNMAEAMVKGLLGSGRSEPGCLVASDILEERRALLAERYGIAVTADNLEVVRRAEVLVLAVKPQFVPDVLAEIGPEVSARHLVISIVAGTTIATIQAALPQGTRVVRCMPNTPALVGAGITALAPGATVGEAELELASAVLSSMGETLVLAERYLDAVTGLSGSGPAFVAMIIEALSDGGVLMGLPRDVALKLAAATVHGTARLALELGEHPGRLKDMVTSPGGTTICGVHALESGGLRAALMNAVRAATERSIELGK